MGQLGIDSYSLPTSGSACFESCTAYARVGPLCLIHSIVDLIMYLCALSCVYSAKIASQKPLIPRLRSLIMHSIDAQA